MFLESPLFRVLCRPGVIFRIDQAAEIQVHRDLNFTGKFFHQAIDLPPGIFYSDVSPGCVYRPGGRVGG